MPNSHRRPLPVERFHFGAPYYPEHWSEEERRGDPQLMAKAGFNMVRMVEFAWDRMEPEEGELDFSLFDESIDALGAEGIDTMLCTPTATPPVWLARKMPDMHRVDAEGRAMEHGSRQHACHNHPGFREHSRRITAAMAEHWKDHPKVVAWQTDNEFNCNFAECHCDTCQGEFVTFLRERYEDDIEALNVAWGTSFWAQTYGDFSQITTPRPNRPCYLNPGHQLDFARFISWSVTSFQREQVEILREANPDWFIQHNGIFRKIDYRGPFQDDLDSLGYDIYPMFDGDPDHRRFSHTFNLDRARSMGGNFFVPEHQCGPGGQAPYCLDTPERGEMRMLTWRSIARGADGLLYFRWRTCRTGAEQYWRGVLDHDNRPGPRYEEVCAVGDDLKKVGQEVLGSSVRVEVALAGWDYEVEETHQAYSLGLPSPMQVSEELHGVLLREG